MARKRVLTISEVRERLREVREEALFRSAVIHWGDRGRDELVTLSLNLFQRLVEHGNGSGGKPEESAWSAFEVALADGGLNDSGDVEPRRRMPGLRQTSGVDWSEIPSFVGPERRPRRRRSAE